MLGNRTNGSKWKPSFFVARKKKKSKIRNHNSHDTKCYCIRNDCFEIYKVMQFFSCVFFFFVQINARATVNYILIVFTVFFYLDFFFLNFMFSYFFFLFFTTQNVLFAIWNMNILLLLDERWECLFYLCFGWCFWHINKSHFQYEYSIYCSNFFFHKNGWSESVRIEQKNRKQPATVWQSNKHSIWIWHSIFTHMNVLSWWG